MDETGRSRWIVLGLCGLLLAAGALFWARHSRSGARAISPFLQMPPANEACSQPVKPVEKAGPAASLPASPEPDPLKASESGCLSAGSGQISRPETTCQHRDPTEPLLSYRTPGEVRKNRDNKGMVPPPPPAVPLQPPPEPAAVSPSSPASCPGSQRSLKRCLTSPPATERVRLSAVVDDKVILTFPANMCKTKQWPPAVTLGAGEKINSVSVVSIGKDSVTLQENGKRCTKYIEPVH